MKEVFGDEEVESDIFMDLDEMQTTKDRGDSW